MSDYRRNFIAGGTYFFTVVTSKRFPIFNDTAAQNMLGQIIRDAKQRWPFDINAIVLLPDHLHTLWSLPSGDVQFSKRMGWIKKEFTKQWRLFGGREQALPQSRLRRGDAGIWQPRFWEHTIRDETDFERHFDYIHYNPVKHGLVGCAKDWSASSFHRYCSQGVYDRDWGCSSRGALGFDDLVETAAEP